MRLKRIVKRASLALGGAFGCVTLGGVLFGSCVLALPRYEGPVSDHFDGERFRNHEPIPHAGLADLLRWQRERDVGPWREHVENEPFEPPPARVFGGRARVTFVNHSTLLVQMDGLNVLTDPIWSERASPVPFAGPRRVRPPGVSFEALPKIDVVLVSHNHYDHMDVETLRAIASRDRPRVFVGLGNLPILERAGIEGAAELDWWQEASLGEGLRLFSVPAQHFSQRGIGDRDRGLWSGYVLEGPSGRVYFAGDTGYGRHFAEIRERLGPVRLALLPIGAYRPRWFMSPVHIDPEEAVRAARDLEAGTSVGMHFGTFILADDGEKEPLIDLEKALGEAGAQAPRFWVLGFGEGREVP